MGPSVKASMSVWALARGDRTGAATRLEKD